ncbi:hypothetical protein C8R44DRAFT_724250 [Mycena epipterygia]|nr:hypothetical protein C8R44DRAFT_724250 [Mycena epipterygia]
MAAESWPKETQLTGKGRDERNKVVFHPIQGEAGLKLSTWFCLSVRRRYASYYHGIFFPAVARSQSSLLTAHVLIHGTFIPAPGKLFIHNPETRRGRRIRTIRMSWRPSQQPLHNRRWSKSRDPEYFNRAKAAAQNCVRVVRLCQRRCMRTRKNLHETQEAMPSSNVSELVLNSAPDIPESS